MAVLLYPRSRDINRVTSPTHLITPSIANIIPIRRLETSWSVFSLYVGSEWSSMPFFPYTPLLDLSNPINDNVWRRYSTLLAIKILNHIRPCRGCVFILTNTLCVKYGSHVHLSEASTMRFLTQHTSIPVPEVYCGFTYSDIHRDGKDQGGHDW